MVSYSGNFEDVILHRALADVRNGCYADVGASHPIAYSNTYAFYEKGWRGICVEPIGAYSGIWREARAEDVFVNAALGASAGQTTFHIYQQTPQLSTGSKATVQAWRKDGRLPDQSVAVPVLTLNSVLEQHLAGRTLHLLSIDVEGMEKDVLAGFDLGKYRPWVVVIEATRPGTPEPDYAGWEPMLLAAGYSMVYMDGLNRFYLSGEHPELRGRFALPPNVFDHFELARERDLRVRCAELEAQLAALKTR